MFPSLRLSSRTTQIKYTFPVSRKFVDFVVCFKFYTQSNENPVIRSKLLSNS